MEEKEVVFGDICRVRFLISFRLCIYLNLGLFYFPPNEKEKKKGGVWSGVEDKCFNYFLIILIIFY